MRNLCPTALPWLAVAALALNAAECAAEPVTEIGFSESYKGGPPVDYFWSSADAAVLATATRNVNPPVDTVGIFFTGSPPYSNFASVIFSTENLPGQALVPGVYADAQRFGFEPPGHPGFDLIFNNRGFNEEFGTFTVLEAAYDFSTPNPTVVSFAATFDIQGDASHLVGHVYYNYTPDSMAAPAPPSGLLLAVGAGVAWGYARWRTARALRSETTLLARGDPAGSPERRSREVTA
jgi:hypothetical protein